MATTWVGIKSCGCVVAAVSGRLNRLELAHDVGEMVLRGYQVEERPADEVVLRRCECGGVATHDLGGEGG